MTFRDRLDAEKLLTALGIKYERHNRKLQASCPSPDHNDRNPSWSIVDAPGTYEHGGHKCMSCGFCGGPWELVMAVRGVDKYGAADFVRAITLDMPRDFGGLPKVVIREQSSRQEYRLPSGVRIPSVDGSQWHPDFFKYLVGRGVTIEQMNRWHIGYATTGPLKWRVVIPVHTRGKLVAHVGRAIFDDRTRYDMPTSASGARSHSALFGEPLLDRECRTLTIAEGSFSALALERAIAPNPIALLGSDWNASKAAILGDTQWEHVIVATDPDKAGDRVAKEIERSFRDAKISRLRMSHSPDDVELDVLTAEVAAVVAAV